MKKGVKKGLKITAIILGVILALLLLVAIFISPIAEYVIEKNCKEWIGRQITMDDLSINLFTGSLEAEALCMKEQDDKTDFVSIDTLKVAINPFKLLAKEVNIRYVTLNSPKVRLVQYDSTFNFTDLTKLGGDKEDDEDDKDKEPWAIGIYNIKLTGGTLSYRDEVRDSKWNLNNLHLEVPGVYFSGKTTDAGVSFQFAEGGSLSTKAKYDMENGRYDVVVKLTGLDIDNFMPYIKESLNVSSVSGKLAGDVHVNGSTQTPSDIDIVGSVTISGFNANDLNDNKVASLNSLNVNVNKINPQKGVCDIASVTVDGLSSHFDMYKDHNNFSNLVKTSDNKPEEKKAEPDTVKSDSKPMVVSIKKIELKNSDFTFADNTLRMPFIYKLSNINAVSENFSPSAAENNLHLTMDTQGGGAAIVNWKGGLDGIRNQKLTIILKHVDLQQFSPYSMEYFAYPLEKGKLSIMSENIVRDYNLVGRNNLDIFNCRVGNKNKKIKTEFNIPLKTGLYILRDKDDKITLDLPVKGNVNSPEFSYKKLILKTLGNLMVKLAVSPVNALASGLGLSADELSQIPFDATKPDLTSQEYARVDKIIAALETNSELSLKLTQQVNMKNAIKKRTVFEMKRRYYVSKHPQAAGQRLSLVDFGEINDIKDSDSGLKSFVNNLSSIDGSFYEQAESIFPADSAVSALSRQMAFRNKLVTDYIVKHGVPAEKLTVRNMSADSLKSYTGADKYAVDIFVPNVAAE